MDFPFSVDLPILWNGRRFEKNRWGAINYLVGPNGTGKTLFAEMIRHSHLCNDLRPRYLGAERLTGLERRDYRGFSGDYLPHGFNLTEFKNYKAVGADSGLAGHAFVLLKEKMDLRIRVEATIAHYFNRKIRLVERGGYMTPLIQKTGGAEYELKKNESHGLKQLIALLTLIYDDEYRCMIIDEPELHLHPQFQMLLLQEMRAMAGNPRTDSSKKIFFIATHSPYFIDIRTIEDLKNCIVFQPNKLPAYIDQLDSDDEWTIRRFLPRLNTHHKQFFFASRPIFVEGYFDQQLFMLIQEKRSRVLGAAGSCIIDVGGKDELDMFFRICGKLNIDAQFICDLDALFRGRIRQSGAADFRCQSFVQGQGLGCDLMEEIGKLEKEIDKCVATPLATSGEGLSNSFQRAMNSQTEPHEKRRIFSLALRREKSALKVSLPAHVNELNFIEGALTQTLNALERCGVYVLPGGELENYLPTYVGCPYTVPDSSKSNVFNTERDFLLSNDLTEDQMRQRYGDLLAVLDKASKSEPVNMDEYLGLVIGEWIHRVQMAFRSEGFDDKESLLKSGAVEWDAHSRIFELLEFGRIAGGFSCRVSLRASIDRECREIVFDHNTVAANYHL